MSDIKGELKCFENFQPIRKRLIFVFKTVVYRQTDDSAKLTFIFISQYGV